jgi:hypothetical protein
MIYQQPEILATFLTKNGDKIAIPSESKGFCIVAERCDFFGIIQYSDWFF